MNYRTLKEVEAVFLDIDPQIVAAFSVRVAARSLLVLGNTSPFGHFLEFWRNAEEKRHLLSVFRALAIAYYLLLSREESGLDNTIDGIIKSARSAALAARATADIRFVETAGINAAEAADVIDSVIHSISAVLGCYQSPIETRTNAAGVVVSVSKYPDFFEKELAEIISIESALDYLQSPLWGGESSFLSQKSKVLYSQLTSPSNEFLYWARWYKCRINGDPLSLDELNDCIYIPPEIQAQGVRSVNEYLDSLEHAQISLDRMRAMFIGYGEAGKTSLIRALHHEDILEGKEEMTPGVEIRDWPLPDSEAIVHIWDFGGQVMAHATHQFFLRERCVYVLVLHARPEINANQQAEYWLEHIRTFGGGAPVLIVGNKADILEVRLDLHSLYEKYQNISGFFSLFHVHDMIQITKKNLLFSSGILLGS